MPGAARAQFIDTYLPSTVPGYQPEASMAVTSRPRPLYDPSGIRVEDFILRPSLDESFGYNSNVVGFKGAPGSTFLRTTPTVTANSDWSRNQFGISVSADDYQYLDQPKQSYTDWTVGIGGGYTIGQHDLILAYSHLSLHETAATIGSVAATTPLPFSFDDLRTEYTFATGRFTFTPRVELQHYDFGNTSIGGVTQSQAYQNRVTLIGGVETHYMLTDQRSLVLVVEGVDSHFLNPAAGQPTYNSNSALVLGGIDYPASGNWRYRLLIGAELRAFQSKAYPNRVAPVAEASAIYTPTGLTTLTASLARTIEDPAAAGTGGFIYTNARFVVDHEYLRNVLLQGRLGYELAEYLQGGAGTQSAFSIGAGVQWLIDRNLRLALNYDWTSQSGNSYASFSSTGSPVAALNGNFNRNLIALTLHVGL